jgi:hypothetical protein
MLEINVDKMCLQKQLEKELAEKVEHKKEFSRKIPLGKGVALKINPKNGSPHVISCSNSPVHPGGFIAETRSCSCNLLPAKVGLYLYSGLTIPNITISMLENPN